MFKFEFKKIIISKFFGESLFRRSFVICPVLEKTRSEGTEVAGIDKYFELNLYISGNVYLYCCQYSNGFFVLSKCGMSKYWRNISVIITLGVIVVFTCNTFESNCCHSEFDCSCS